MEAHTAPARFVRLARLDLAGAALWALGFHPVGFGFLTHNVYFSKARVSLYFVHGGAYSLVYIHRAWRLPLATTV